MSRLPLLLFALITANAARAADRFIPVFTGDINGITFRTSVDLRSATNEECRFELRAPNGQIFRSVEPVEAGQPKVLDEFAAELQTATLTVAVSCTGSVDVHSRIHESVDGGRTYAQGSLFRAVVPEPLAVGKAYKFPVIADFIVAEIAGAPVHVTGTVTATASNRVTDKNWNLPAFGERTILLNDVLRSLGPMEANLTATGKGQVIILSAITDPAFAKFAPRVPDTVRAQLRAQARAVATPAAPTPPPLSQQLVSASFKAAPFYEPMTGLVYMRDRWYDPKSGSFMTPDPEGYQDSSNLYSFCGGDPINCSDPTGRAASVNRKGDIIGIRPNGSRYFISSAQAKADPVWALRLLESDADLGFDEQEEVMTRAGLRIPYSSACREGENCLSGTRTNTRAFTHLPKGDNWAKNAITATSGLPPQNRQQELVQGGLHIGSTLAPVAIGAYARAKAARQPAITPDDAAYSYDATTGRYRDKKTGRFVSPRNLPYPADDGFASFTDTVLQPGTILDRYGRPSGRFAGKPGDSISQRGLPPGSDDLPYTKYVVLKPIPAKVGPVAEVEPFGAQGGGTQYLFKKPIADLVREGALKAIP